MATTTTTNPTTNNSFGFASPKVPTSKTVITTCNICKRLLYSFEEILVCQSCYGPYHWRCVKPETISHYGENRHFICDPCSDSITSTSTTTNPSHRMSSSGLKTKPSEASERDYQDFLTAPSKVNTIPTKDTNTVPNTRYYDENQQQQPSTYRSPQPGDYSENFPTPINGQYTDDSKKHRRYQEEQARIGTDDEPTTTEMFQAIYQYTPLKEYAALRNDPTTNDNNTYVYQNPISADPDRPLSSSRYGGSLRYMNNDYEQPKSNIRLSPLNNSTSLISSNADNYPNYGRPQHFISTTNLNVNATIARPQQQPNTYKNPMNYSSPYLSQIRDDAGSPYRVVYPQNTTDYNSNVGSDSGIVLNQPLYQNQPKDDNQVMERKLTDLVHKLEHQLENDTRNISDKLDTKLKNLENMINQQTFIIQEQDQVIERLKTKITKIETERDHFRDRLGVQEQPVTPGGALNQTPRETDHKKSTPDPQQGISALVIPRKTSTSSSNATDSKRSSKKAPAPRIDPLEPPVYNNDNESIVAKLISSAPYNPDRRSSDSSTPSITERPPPTNRLDNIIRQSAINDPIDPGTYYQNLDGVQNNDGLGLTQKPSLKPNRLTPTNPTVHQSLEHLTPSTVQPGGLIPANKAVSLDLNPKPVRANEPQPSISTPAIGTYPAAQYPNVTKGVLRKRNPDSFFKRLDPFYFVLTNDQLLMFKRDVDRNPHKRINLAGARLATNQDQKYGNFLLLTWLPPNKGTKYYQLFASNQQETDKWQQALQTAIANIGGSTRS